MSTITTDIELAISHLKQGQVVAIPTETVYGLAGNAENEQAIKSIYAMKNRPLQHPLIMHVASDWDLSQWVVHIPDYAYVLMSHFWPGPLTLVMPCKPNGVNPLVTGGQDTIALRCPQHPITQTLLQRLGFPLVAPSANPFGKISPTTAEHVQHSFSQEELLIRNGGRCQVGIESTIVAAVNPNGYEILRHGSIDAGQINDLLSCKALKNTSSIRVPGKLASHYQPEKPLYYFSNAELLSKYLEPLSVPAYVISFTQMPTMNPHCYYQLPDSPELVAFELYYQLRQADQSTAQVIVIELPPEQDAWQAIRERLLKAGQPGSISS